MPIFGLSRYPSSDYRAFLIIGLIYFAMLAGRSFIEREIPWRSFVVRTGLAAAWFVLGISLISPVLRSPEIHRAAEVYRAAAVFAASLLILFLLRWRPQSSGGGTSRFALPGLCLLLLGVSSLDAAGVLGTMIFRDADSAWLVPGFSGYYERNGWPLMKDGRLLTYSIPDNLPASRPARIEKTEFLQYSWEGFFTGRYTFLSVMTPNQLSGNLRVNQRPAFMAYMLREWLPLFFAEKPEWGDSEAVTIPPPQIGAGAALPEGSSSTNARQVNYGMDTIEYRVSLPEPMLMVENEEYFPGWTATLRSAQGTQSLEAVMVDEVFRGWHLPAGEYQMTARFHLPGTGLFRGLSLAAFGLWVALILAALWRQKRLIPANTVLPE